MIIGFNGSMGVGKSTAIEAIRGLGSPVALVKFAGPLYEIQELIYDKISPVYTRPDTFIKDRKLLQWIGSDWARETISKTVWVDLWKAKVREYERNGAPIIVCDDVRFDNEAEAIHSVGGLVVKLTGPSRCAQDGIASHSSEAGIDPNLVDKVIPNNGDLAAFKAAIAHFYYNAK